MIRKTHSFRLAVASATTAALLIVPVATAGDPGPDAFERAVNARLSTEMPDAFERAVNAHNASLGTIASPGRTVPDVVESVGTSSVSVPSNGFDWGSAAIGGSAMLALVLLVSGGALATRHSRSRVALR